MSETFWTRPLDPAVTARDMQVVDETWPAARLVPRGRWLLRDGGGGGKRVSSGSREDPDAGETEIDEAEAAMQAMGQDRLFSIRPGQEPLDMRLQARGYKVVDPVWIRACAIGHLTGQDRRDGVMGIPAWPILALQRDIWETGGIGPARTAIMARVTGPKTSLIGRIGQRAAGSAFVGIARDGTAMLHALEVLESARGAGLGRRMMLDAAHWAQAQGAERFAIVVTTRNVPANALYERLGMDIVGKYHYRIKTTQESPA